MALQRAAAARTRPGATEQCVAQVWSKLKLFLAMGCCPQPFQQHSGLAKWGFLHACKSTAPLSRSQVFVHACIHPPPHFSRRKRDARRQGKDMRSRVKRNGQGRDDPRYSQSKLYSLESGSGHFSLHPACPGWGRSMACLTCLDCPSLFPSALFLPLLPFPTLG